MKLKIWATMLGMVVAFPWAGLAQTSDERSMSPSRAQRFLEAKELARPLLLKRVEEVDWLEATFEEVVEWLAGQGDYKVNVIPHWRSLSEESVERDSLVTLRVRNVSVAEVLNEVLDQVNDSGALRYFATGNTIKITTRRAMEKNLETRVYRVTDLIFQIPDMVRSAPVVDLEAAARQGQGGGGGQGVFAGSGGSGTEDLEEEPQDLLERLEELKTLIETHIEPLTWQPVGGVGVVTIVNDRQLVVTNTIDVHEKIGGFFTR